MKDTCDFVRDGRLPHARLPEENEHTLRFGTAYPITDVIQEGGAGAFKTAFLFAEAPTRSIWYFTDFGVELCGNAVGSTVRNLLALRTSI